MNSPIAYELMVSPIYRDSERAFLQRQYAQWFPRHTWHFSSLLAYFSIFIGTNYIVLLNRSFSMSSSRSFSRRQLSIPENSSNSTSSVLDTIGPSRRGGGFLVILHGRIFCC